MQKDSNYIKQVIHGDCYKILPTLDQKYALVLTDPPYGNLLSENWDIPHAINDTWCKMVKAIMLPNASLYMWCGVGEKSNSMLDFMQILNRHFHFKDLITWKKRRGIGARRGWLYTREELLWYVVDNNNFIWNKEFQYSDEPNAFKKGMSGTEVNPHKRYTNVWTDIPEELVNSNKKHPTEKPKQALDRIINVHTYANDWVLDPFAGGCSTLDSAYDLGRNSTGIEINKEYLGGYGDSV